MIVRYFTLIAALALACGCDPDAVGGTGGGNGRGGAGGTGGTGGTGAGGPGATCGQRLAFDLVCPEDILVDATGQITVENYDAANINQLSFGASGSGAINPPAFQEPEPANTNTNIPLAPYVFTFNGLIEGDVRVQVTTFDLSENNCSVAKFCDFNVVQP